MAPTRSAPTLRDLGERRIVADLIAPRFPAPPDTLGIGDDCAVLPPPPEGELLVVTTDPCPSPVVCMLEEPDVYHYGWMTALINLSDLGAMGARPLGLLVSTVMREDMPAADYERFLDGLADAGKVWGCPVLGGNIKDGPEFTATGTAFGAVRREHLLRRGGARPGDRVCVVGDMGLFWAAVLDRLAGGLPLAEDRRLLDRALRRPVARLAEGQALARTGQVSACMDASDGVSGCLRELAAVNGVDIVIDSAALRPMPVVAEVGRAAAVDPRKLLLSWGNWELVCTVRPGAAGAVRAVVEGMGTAFADLGEVRAGPGRVCLDEGGRVAPLFNLASERFCGTSLFTHGLSAYADFLRSAPLTEGHRDG